MRKCGGAAVLVLAAWALGASAGRGQEAKGLPKEVLDLAAEVGKGKDVSAATGALARKFGGARAVMRLYNPRDRGGLGSGPRGKGLERRLSDLAEKPLPDADLDAARAELTALVSVNLVLADLTARHAPAKPLLGRGKAEWDRDLDGVRAGTKALGAALAARDPKAVQAAATRINAACNSCHDGAR